MSKKEERVGCIIFERKKVYPDMYQESRYYDKNGVEICEGDDIRYPSGRVEHIYLTDIGTLGTDATNPLWIEKGRAVPCEYGIYSLTPDDCKEVEVIK